MWCFHYDHGRTLKLRILEKLYFCSEECRREFAEHDPSHLLTDVLLLLESKFTRLVCEIDEEDIPPAGEIDEQIINRWQLLHVWEEKLHKAKKSKRDLFLPRITKEDYLEIKYVLGVLHYEYRILSGVLSEEEIKEKAAFDMLQLSELDKIYKYPYLLPAYINIFKTIKVLAPPEYLPFVTQHHIRAIIGRNLTNAFGIWSPATHEDEEREFFGFGVYPSASFFNHSCAFNVKKIRHGRAYEFITCRDVAEGDELCISYGLTGLEPVQERQKLLNEWFFSCGCPKCTADLRRENSKSGLQS